MAEQIQTVTLCLSDGRRLYFTGRYQADPAIFDTLRVTDVLRDHVVVGPSFAVRARDPSGVRAAPVHQQLHPSVDQARALSRLQSTTGTMCGATRYST